MGHKQTVANRLAALGVSLNDAEIDQLAVAYASLLKWERIVQEMVQKDTEPAVIFKASVED
jgi:hypothetical protein